MCVYIYIYIVDLVCITCLYIYIYTHIHISLSLYIYIYIYTHYIYGRIRQVSVAPPDQRRSSPRRARRPASAASEVGAIMLYTMLHDITKD